MSGWLVVVHGLAVAVLLVALSRRSIEERVRETREAIDQVGRDALLLQLRMDVDELRRRLDRREGGA